ncbi:MAG: SPOR domain-containing protein [Acidovorax sp.]|uniref:SPOR domain-containing protein n=1 Tax=Acidovorax sp. TaxID=1872122 RepID=UPI0039E6E3ED
MAFFKFRWPGQGEQPSQQAEKTARRPRNAPQAESIEVMRRRARHRLIGAAVLVLIGVIGFPMLFDTQPRPIPVDIPIEIPDRNKVAPLVTPAPVEQPAAVRAPAAPAAPVRNSNAASNAASNGLADGEEFVPSTRPAASRPAAAAAPKPEPKPEPKPAPQRPDDAVRARALLEGRPSEPAAAAAEERFIVQVGAFEDAAKVREVRMKVERAGLKTYTQVAGKLTRVRVGPFNSRAEADKAAARIKALDLSASVLTL